MKFIPIGSFNTNFLTFQFQRLQFQRSVPENNVYAVRFNDNSISECLAKNMIGTNFKPLSDFCNQPFQKVSTVLSFQLVLFA